VLIEIQPSPSTAYRRAITLLLLIIQNAEQIKLHYSIAWTQWLRYNLTLIHKSASSIYSRYNHAIARRKYLIVAKDRTHSEEKESWTNKDDRSTHVINEI